MRLVGRDSWPVAAAFVASSFVSNGMISRPLIALILWMAFAVAGRPKLSETAASPTVSATTLAHQLPPAALLRGA
jgi:hypothetical protein